MSHTDSKRFLCSKLKLWSGLAPLRGRRSSLIAVKFLAFLRSLHYGFLKMLQAKGKSTEFARTRLIYLLMDERSRSKSVEEISLKVRFFESRHLLFLSKLHHTYPGCQTFVLRGFRSRSTSLLSGFGQHQPASHEAGREKPLTPRVHHTHTGE